MSNNYPTLGNSPLGGNDLNSQSPERINAPFAARVINISLESSDQPDSLYQITNKLWGIGAIEFESLTKSTNTNNENNIQAGEAFPMDVNFRKVPTLGEVVFIVKGPSFEQSTKNKSEAYTFYYFNPISVWNQTHLNMLPSNAAYNEFTDTVDDENVSKGIPNNSDSQIEEPKPGNTFGEITSIRNLYPVEGDVILEGRWGNSLRFSSTAVHTSESKNSQSPWSTSGENGSPITILRNGQGSTSEYDNWFPIYEDINKDASSIYLTDGQPIPINITAYPFDSFKTDAKPPIDTTANIQETDIVDPNKSNVSQDSTDINYDLVNTNGPLTEETTTDNG